ncbi:hypothetical protein GOBAR_AA18470 [Gossypium barbadense]|uniref:Uncharacterized protein n=1 Tax=Gossypium barbadense TaxID=3634 RepID=A0A2P5XFS6_GOSBA|nr:hypothetical protein GOBAR_AA18470 [Gossypium barbadense]
MDGGMRGSRGILGYSGWAPNWMILEINSKEAIQEIQNSGITAMDGGMRGSRGILGYSGWAPNWMILEINSKEAIQEIQVAGEKQNCLVVVLTIKDLL